MEIKRFRIQLITQNRQNFVQVDVLNQIFKNYLFCKIKVQLSVKPTRKDIKALRKLYFFQSNL